MPIATLNNIEKTFGRRVLFNQLNLNIDRGERIGLIGTPMAVGRQPYSKSSPAN